MTFDAARLRAEQTVRALLRDAPSYLVGDRAFGAIVEHPDPATCEALAIRWQTAVNVHGPVALRLLCGRCGKVVGRAMPGWTAWVPHMHVMSDPEWRPPGTRSPRSAQALDAGPARIALGCRCGARHTLNTFRLGERWMERVHRTRGDAPSLIVGSGPYADTH